jgi:hypothetical protein
VGAAALLIWRLGGARAAVFATTGDFGRFEGSGLGLFFLAAGFLGVACPGFLGCFVFGGAFA